VDIWPVKICATNTQGLTWEHAEEENWKDKLTKVHLENQSL